MKEKSLFCWFFCMTSPFLLISVFFIFPLFPPSLSLSVSFTLAFKEVCVVAIHGDWIRTNGVDESLHITFFWYNNVSLMKNCIHVMSLSAGVMCVYTCTHLHCRIFFSFKLCVWYSFHLSAIKQLT